MIKLGEEKAFSVFVPLQNDKLNTIDDIKLACEKINLESNESLQRSTNILDKTIQIGNETMQRLQKNNIQFSNAEKSLNQIDNDISESNRELRSIHSITGQLQNSLCSHKKYDHDVTYQKQNNGVYLKSNFKICDNETDTKINEIGSQVQDLKKIAITMSSTLDKQNEQLDNLLLSTEQQNQRLKKSKNKISREF